MRTLTLGEVLRAAAAIEEEGFKLAAILRPLLDASDVEAAEREVARHRQSSIGPEHCLYLVRDAELALYAGKSRNGGIGRVWNHVHGWGGGGASALGRMISKHAPESLAWAVDLFTVEDCREPIGRHFPGAPATVELAERALILEHRPALNVRDNPHPRPLPEKYRDPEGEADEGWRGPAAAIGLL